MRGFVTGQAVLVVAIWCSGCSMLANRDAPNADVGVVPVSKDTTVAGGGAATRSVVEVSPPMAEGPGYSESDPCAQPAPQDERMVEKAVDKSREFLEERTCAASLWLDGLFGDQRNVAAARGTYGQFELGESYSQFSGFNTRVRMRVRVDLPNLKHRVSAFFGRDNEEDFVQDRSEALALRGQFPRVDDNDKWLAGLGYSLPGSERLQTDFRVGVHGLNPPRLFVQARAHYNLYSDRVNLVYIRGTPFWNTRDGFGFTAGFEYNRALSDTMLLRFANVGTISQESAGIDWLSAVSLYQNLHEQRGLGYEVFVRGATRAPEPLGEYGVRLIYRHPVVPDRFYVRLIPGYSWPRDDPALAREGSYNMAVVGELPFGQKPER
jgi:hypothetical protein